jgi:hypothetical protein
MDEARRLDNSECYKQDPLDSTLKCIGFYVKHVFIKFSKLQNN